MAATKFIACASLIALAFVSVPPAFAANDSNGTVVAPSGPSDPAARTAKHRHHKKHHRKHMRRLRQGTNPETSISAPN